MQDRLTDSELGDDQACRSIVRQGLTCSDLPELDLANCTDRLVAERGSPQHLGRAQLHSSEARAEFRSIRCDRVLCIDCRIAERIEIAAQDGQVVVQA